MNFRSLLIILYLFLIQNSEALSERVIDLIRGTRRVLEYAPRTPRVSTSQQVASDDACAYEHWSSTRCVLLYAPRTWGFQPLYKGSEDSLLCCSISSLLSSLLHRFSCRSYPEVPVSYSSPEASPEIPKIPKSAVPESKLCPREVRFSRRSSRSAEEYYFYKP